MSKGSKSNRAAFNCMYAFSFRHSIKAWLIKIGAKICSLECLKILIICENCIVIVIVHYKNVNISICKLYKNNYGIKIVNMYL